MSLPTKPWKHIKHRYTTGSEDKVLVLQSEEITKIFAFKKINKVIFSSSYRDLVIGVTSGETLSIKNYFCPSCAEMDYDQNHITKMYEETLLGLTCHTILIRKIIQYPNMDEVFHMQIEGMGKRRGEICGFLGPLLVSPRKGRA